MKRNVGAASIAALPALAALSGPASAQATTGIGGMGTALGNGLRAWPVVLLTAAFLFGLWFFIQGWIKLKNHKEDPRENPMSSVALNLVGGGGLMFIAGMATVFSDTFGIGGNQSTAGYGTFSGLGN